MPLSDQPSDHTTVLGRACRDVAGRPEIAAFCSATWQYADTGTKDAELMAAIEDVLRLAAREHVGASVIIGALDLAGCPAVCSCSRPERCERHSNEIISLLRGFLPEH